MAGVGGRADDRVCPSADSGLAGVGLGAGVAIVARRAVRLGWVGAQTGRRVADTRIMALVERDAVGRTAANAGPGAVAGGGLTTEVAVVAGCPSRPSDKLAAPTQAERIGTVGGGTGLSATTAVGRIVGYVDAGITAQCGTGGTPAHAAAADLAGRACVPAATAVRWVLAGIDADIATASPVVGTDADAASAAPRTTGIAL